MQWIHKVQSWVHKATQGQRHFWWCITPSSPHTQAVDSLQRLTVSQQKAALMSKHGQQPLRGLASNSAVVNGADQRALLVHVASDACAAALVCAGATGGGTRWYCERPYGRKKNFSGFHTFLQCHTTLSSLRNGLYDLKSESIFVLCSQACKLFNSLPFSCQTT